MTLCRCQHSLRCVQEQQRRRRRVSALPAMQGAEAAASSCTCTATCKAGIAIGPAAAAEIPKALGRLVTPESGEYQYR